MFEVNNKICEVKINPTLCKLRKIMVSKMPSMQQVKTLIQLAKKGDPLSLKHLRVKLGKTQEEIAYLMNLSGDTIRLWEEGKQQPANNYLAKWRIVLGSCIDGEINAVLSTNSNEVTMKFWALMWELTN